MEFKFTLVAKDMWAVAVDPGNGKWRNVSEKYRVVKNGFRDFGMAGMDGPKLRNRREAAIFLVSMVIMENQRQRIFKEATLDAIEQPQYLN